MGTIGKIFNAIGKTADVVSGLADVANKSVQILDMKVEVMRYEVANDMVEAAVKAASAKKAMTQDQLAELKKIEQMFNLNVEEDKK